MGLHEHHSCYGVRAALECASSRRRLAALLVLSLVSAGDSQIMRTDPAGDTVIRRTDPGANGTINPISHRLPDVIAYTIGSWSPSDPQTDPFTGDWISGTADFFRLDVVFSGLMNPPGTLGNGFPYDPFKYGPNPLYGYLEIDMDADETSGGELHRPDLRYLGNTSRFAGLPPLFYYAGRAALDDSAFNKDFYQPPHVERSGEEFHLAFHGWQISSIWKSDPAHTTFASGDRWIVFGQLFHRAHGYEPFSFACCQGVSGSYQPVVQILFQHDPLVDQTTVSLVYPLTNAGSAALSGSATVEPLDGDASDQNSISEALDDLVFSAQNASSVLRDEEEFALIAGWADKNATDYLDPANWRINMALATAYGFEQDDDALYAWTDIAPDVVAGDLDGNGIVDTMDTANFDDYLATHDGLLQYDSDGQADGIIHIPSFGRNFSLYDVNYDGLVDANDRAFIVSHRTLLADFDRDGDVDLDDFGHLQRCLYVWPVEAGCVDADLDRDGSVSDTDLQLLTGCAQGAGVPADPACIP